MHNNQLIRKTIFIYSEKQDEAPSRILAALTQIGPDLLPALIDWTILKRILILDDNQDILDIVEEALTYEQFEVHGTTLANDIIPLIEKIKPDLVLLDYRVSGTNGGEICKRIKSNISFGNIPVIIFSAYISSGKELSNYGCDAVINKPFNLDELVTKVNSLIQ